MYLRIFRRYGLLLSVAACLFALGNVFHPLLHGHAAPAEHETAAVVAAPEAGHDGAALGADSLCPVCAGHFAGAVAVSAEDFSLFSAPAAEVPAPIVFHVARPIGMPQSRGPPTA